MWITIFRLHGQYSQLLVYSGRLFHHVLLIFRQISKLQNYYGDPKVPMTWLLREDRGREKLRQWYQMTPQIFISILSYSYRQNSSLHLLISWYFIILYQGVSLVSNININSQSYFSRGSRWSLQKCSLRSSQHWL